LTEQTAHGGLMTTHEFSESVVVIIKKNSGYEVCVRQ
jgi:hypothetical protein